MSAPPKDLAEEAKELSRLLRTYQHEYYVLADPSVSDEEYDRLFDRLVAIEREYPELSSDDSPTRRVGSDLDHELPEVAHNIPVLSLDKAYQVDELQKWMGKLEGEPVFTVEQKIDGVSIVLYYEEGRLARAVTRGNGQVGNDVTPNVRTIGAVPLSLPEPLTVAVRGEIFLPKSGFASLPENHGYANPRNLAAGSIRRIKSSETAKIPLTIFVYEGFFQPPVPTHLEVLDRLQSLGFRINPHLGVFSHDGNAGEARAEFRGTYDQIGEYVEAQTALRTELDYEIDGLVLKVDDLDTREAMGYTGHHPRWAIAYKFEAPRAKSTVLAIDVQVGRTGRITPVARIEPVAIGGSTVRNVTLHNQDYIDALDLGIGDEVAVSKRGDVIPAVEEVLEKRAPSPWKMPEACPSCGSNLVVDGAHLFCRNEECPDKIRGRLRFFLGKDQMDIDNFGPETLGLLIDRGFVRDVPDIYTFDFDRLFGEEGFGEKKIALLKKGVQESKGRSFERVLTSLGLLDLGQKAAELLIGGGFRSIEPLLEAADADDRQALTAIKGIGDTMAESILRQLRDPAVRARIQALRAAGLSFEAPEAAENDNAGPEPIFEGQKWCVTGSFEFFKPRSLAMDEVKKRGGAVVTGVTGATTHLLAGEAAGSKLSKAKELGVAIVTEEEFRSMLGET